METVSAETNDEDLIALFRTALDVHLANKDELVGYAQLFPSGGIGVAQGSSLSAFASNVLLYDLDHELNELGVTAVRYIDDIFIVSKTEKSTRGSDRARAADAWKTSNCHCMNLIPIRTKQQEVCVEILSTFWVGQCSQIGAFPANLRQIEF